MPRTTLPLLVVHPSPLDRRRGRLQAGPLILPCALGRAGTTRAKREGDGATPVGTFRILKGFRRSDRLRRPRTGLALAPIRPSDGWCDDPGDRLYNRPVPLPYPARYEALWREDGVYDLVLDLAWNRGPIVKGRGSAIFLHLARPGLEPTAGCIAIRRGDVPKLLGRIGPRTRIRVLP